MSKEHDAGDWTYTTGEGTLYFEQPYEGTLQGEIYREGMPGNTEHQAYKDLDALMRKYKLTRISVWWGVVPSEPKDSY